MPARRPMILGFVDQQLLAMKEGAKATFLLRQWIDG
jgi:hypothetical protein